MKHTRFTCAFFFLCAFVFACANNPKKDEVAATEYESVALYDDEPDDTPRLDQIDDTICVVNGKAFRYRFKGIGDSSEIYDEERVWVSTQPLEIIPLPDTSAYSFYVSTPYKSLMVDFSDEKSLAQLPTLAAKPPHFECIALDSVLEEGFHAYYSFKVDFPSNKVPHASSIRQWLIGKIIPRDSLASMGDIKDNRQIARFATSFYFNAMRADHEEFEGAAEVEQAINLQAKLYNDRFVTYQQFFFVHEGGIHGYFTEMLLSYDHVNKMEIDNSYLFKPGHEKEIVDLLMEEAKKSASYKKTMPDILASVADKDEDGNLTGRYALPEAGLSEDGAVFSFQPYEIDSFAAGTFHFVLPYEKLTNFLTDRAKWCLGM